MSNNTVTLAHGAGGKQTSELIERVFNPKYPKEYIERIDGIIDSKKRITEFYKGGDEA